MTRFASAESGSQIASQSSVRSRTGMPHSPSPKERRRAVALPASALAIVWRCHRDRGAADRPSSKLRRVLAQAKEARHAYISDRQHVNRDRPGGRGPPIPLRQAPPLRHEPPGHLRSDGQILWVSPRSQARSTTRLPPGSGASCGNWPPPGWWCSPIRATSGPGPRAHTLLGPRQAHFAEGR